MKELQRLLDVFQEETLQLARGDLVFPEARQAVIDHVRSLLPPEAFSEAERPDYVSQLGFYPSSYRPKP